MSYFAYKLIHFVGIFLLITTLSFRGTHALMGGRAREARRWWLVVVLHLTAAALVMFGGFGMLARLGLIEAGVPAWATVKVGVLGGLVAAIAVVYRGRAWARVAIVAAPLLAATAAALALFKPI